MIKNNRTIFTVYIAGPYRADTINGVRSNIEAARNAAIELVTRGIHFRCPHTMTGLMDGVASDEYFLELGLEMLRDCQAVLVVGFWQNSVGTCKEWETAINLGIKRTHKFETIERFKKEWEAEQSAK